MSEWQPIETAPKDGTYILLGDNRYKHPAYLHAAWDKHARGWWTEATQSGHSAVWSDATHWMPLPELPA